MRAEHNGEIYAIYVSEGEIKQGTEWFGDASFPLQASRMVYPKDKSFKAHKHILNPRIIKRTQEAFIVMSGKISVEIYSDNQEFISNIEAGAGDAVLIYKGYHLVKVLEDCVVFEIKAGQHDGYLSEEKEFLNV